MLGVAVMQATSDENSIYAKGYEQSGAGGLLGAVLIPPLGRFGKFCLVVLALSIIANNCPNLYSVGLTAQVLGRWTQRVPRFLWTGVATGVYIAISIPGYVHFEDVLENFMNFIGESMKAQNNKSSTTLNNSAGYWLAIYEGIALVEHFVFRRGIGGYRPDQYDQPSALPPGIAAVAAFCIGVVGMVMGMSQVWFVGPIAIHVGEPPYGGDIGFELAFGFAALSYLGFRALEKRYFKR